MTDPMPEQEGVERLVEQLQAWSLYSYHEMHQPSARQLFDKAAATIAKLQDERDKQAARYAETVADLRAAEAEVAKLQAAIEEQDADHYETSNQWRSQFDAMQRRAMSAEAEVAKLRSALEQARDWLRSAPLESGYCCCGSPVEGHGMGDGHSPVDDLAYSASGLEEAITIALNKEARHAE